jgi:hypothetical protein
MTVSPMASRLRVLVREDCAARPQQVRGAGPAVRQPPPARRHARAARLPGAQLPREPLDLGQLGRRPAARKVLGWPKKIKVAHAFLAQHDLRDLRSTRSPR